MRDICCFTANLFNHCLEALVFSRLPCSGLISSPNAEQWLILFLPMICSSWLLLFSPLQLAFSCLALNNNKYLSILSADLIHLTWLHKDYLFFILLILFQAYIESVLLSVFSTGTLWHLYWFPLFLVLYILSQHVLPQLSCWLTFLKEVDGGFSDSSPAGLVFPANQPAETAY